MEIDKNAMKMKRVDIIGKAEPEIVVKPASNEVVMSAGVVTVVDAEAQAQLKAEGTSTPKPRSAAKSAVVSQEYTTEKGVISTNAPKDIVVEEVSLADWQKDQQSDLADGKTSAMDKIRKLIGATVDEAKKVLEDMKSAKQVSAWRVVPIGQTMTMDMQPGRVQVLVDAAQKVVDVQVS